ncbi:MAG: Zn-ribbon domain-containing OB-fold protein [Nitrososphaerales archaeon]
MANSLTVDQFYENGRNGKLIGLRCSSGHVTVPPRSTCQSCDSEVLEQIKLSGKGEVVSFTEVYAKSKEFPIETPYVLALVRLLEGGNLLGVLDRKSGFGDLGAKVQVEFRRLNETERWPRLFFVLAN